MLTPRTNKKSTVAKCKLVFNHMSSRVVLRSRGYFEVAAHDKVLPVGFAHAQARAWTRQEPLEKTDRKPSENGKDSREKKLTQPSWLSSLNKG